MQLFFTYKDILSDSNEIRIHKHLVRKRTLVYELSASFAKWLSVRLRTKSLWVRILLLSLKLQIWCVLGARSSLTFRQTIECGFTLKLVRDMMISYSKNFLHLTANAPLIFYFESLFCFETM